MSGVTAVQRCALMENSRPLSLQAYPSRSRAATVVSGSMPSPPYSVGTGKPWIPKLPHFFPGVVVKHAVAVVCDYIVVELLAGKAADRIQ
jgi:hypothetical protein